MELDRCTSRSAPSEGNEEAGQKRAARLLLRRQLTWGGEEEERTKGSVHPPKGSWRIEGGRFVGRVRIMGRRETSAAAPARYDQTLYILGLVSGS